MGRSSTRSSSTSSTAGNDQSQLSERSNVLECFICMEPPTGPVSASCGHVFCWPCMYRWLGNRPKPCPVCRRILRRDVDIIPLYGAGTGAGAGPSNGRGIRSEVAATGVVIPPRPSNPLLFTESTIRRLSDALDLERERVRFLKIERVTLEIKAIGLVHRISHLTEQLRDRDVQLCTERNLMSQGVARMNEMEQRNLVLAQEAHESREREQWHVVRGNQMAEQSTRQQQQLAPANSCRSPQSPGQSDGL